MNATQTDILQSVSRSFGLSIRLLPALLQAPVGIGYLLARATDTVADTTTLPKGERLVLLDLMTQTIAAASHSLEASRELSRLTQAFAAQQSDPRERALLQALPQCLPLLWSLPPSDQGSVQRVLHHITRGQQQDMNRFGDGLRALQTENELDDYTWLVAGCVGEFWTELSARHLPSYSPRPQDEMMRLARAYGMGLQRLNIVRDTGADLSAGRCYWPVETLARAGLNAEMLAHAALSQNADALHDLTPLYTQWLDHTEMQLACGMRYALAICPLRLRLASALPALIGARTLALLRQAGPVALSQHIKMPRHEMRALLVRLALGLGSSEALQAQWKKWSVHSPVLGVAPSVLG